MSTRYSLHSTRSSKSGIVALLTVVIISLFLFSVGILLGVQGNTSIFSGQFTTQADKAQSLAETGIQDAALRISRDASSSGSYTLSETDGTSTVTITSGSPIIVDATGTVGSGKDVAQRAIRAQVTVDADGVITDVTKTSQ